MTLCFHVDDLLCACEDNKDLLDFADQLKLLYIDITLHTGIVHDYLGMDIDFTEIGFCKLDMTKYIKELILEMKVTKNSHIPAFNKLFIIDEESKLLSTEDKEMFHHVVAKMLYLAKRARGDILTTISFLTTRVLEPTIEDWNKMGKVLMYLNSTADLIMRLSSNDNFQVHYYVDASHANH